MSPSIAIVGAGAIGAHLAHELTARGATVTILDAAQAGAGTTAASYGWVNAHDKHPEAYRTLNLLGLRAHERTLRDDPGATWFHQTGLVEIARSAAELDALEAKVERVGGEDYAARMLPSREVLEVEPGIRGEAVSGGALFADEGWIDAPTMCSSLVHRATASGARFLPFHRVAAVTPTGLEARDPDGVAGHHSADIVVLAAGNGIPGLLPKGVDLPLVDPAARDETGATRHPTVGLVSTTGPVDAGIRHLVRAPGIALRPARNGGLTFTDHPTGGRWDRTDPRIWTVPDQLLDRACDIVPGLAHARTETVTVGTRVLPADGLTVADWVEGGGTPVYAIATHSGITLAAHLAEVAADEVLTGRRHSSLEPFGLARFAGRSD